MDQLRNLLAGFNFFQRISIAVGALFAAAAIIGITHYRTESDFRPLYTSMAPEDAAPVVQKLRESGVDFRLADNGGSVLVRTDKLAESRLTLAGAGLPKSGRIGFELFDKTSFGATELVEHINYQRALEGELERSVMSMAEVVQARVHLTLPKESVFLDQQQPAKASVMIKLRSGAQISSQNVLAVTNLVASAVDGLSPDAVAVLDMDGNLLNRPRRSTTDDSAVTSEALEVRRQIEHDLVNKIDSTLEPLLGPNKFRAGASVDCDLTSGDQQEETFDPDKSVMVSSQKSEDDSQHAASAGGIPGTQANLPHPAQNSGGGGSGSHRVESITYQSSRIIRHTRIPQGVIRRMSLSVLVGQEVRWEGDGKNRHRVYVAQPPETLQKIKDLVGGVTGFSAERGDQLIVETLPFESTIESDAGRSPLPAPKQGPPEPQWMQVLDRYRNQIIAVLVGLALLSIALRIIGVRRRGPKEPAVEITREIEAAVGSMQSGGGSNMTGNMTGNMSGPANIIDSALEAVELSVDGKALLGEGQEGDAERIRQLAQRDMTATANVLRMWLDQKA
ncbi:MAG TPA: flagellar basal-body MS-ring/collar protein FliF [Bryobacteraceae bacterium]|jgi:flagellar M-ring protein FliF|nr:flagellar basal-body MS-ring/collar protein FliF [Bryobacteraceae bacterium]